jgi:hypothetical protein
MSIAASVPGRILQDTEAEISTRLRTADELCRACPSRATEESHNLLVLSIIVAKDLPESAT